MYYANFDFLSLFYLSLHFLNLNSKHFTLNFKPLFKIPPPHYNIHILKTKKIEKSKTKKHIKFKFKKTHGIKKKKNKKKLHKHLKILNLI